MCFRYIFFLQPGVRHAYGVNAVACNGGSVWTGGPCNGHAEHVLGQRLRTSELYRQSMCLSEQDAPGVSAQAPDVDGGGDLVGDAVGDTVRDAVGTPVGKAVGESVCRVGIDVGSCVQS